MDLENRPEPTESRKALVTQWTQRITAAKKFWQPIFNKMDEEQRFISGEQSKLDDPEAYQANITNRLVTQIVASAYAKNPKAQARRRESLEFQIYNGDPLTIQEAKARMAQAMTPTVDPVSGLPVVGQVDPADAALLADYEHGMERRRMLDGVARTLELLFDHQLDIQKPPFKRMMKRTLRRACVSRVGWIKLGYRREADPLPTATAAENNGMIQRTRDIQARMVGIEQGEVQPDSAKAEELEILMGNLAKDDDQGTVAVPRQGLEFDFPASSAVIVDPCTANLVTLDGCQWMAQEYLLTAEEILERYGCDVKNHGARAHQQTNGKESEMQTEGRHEWDEKAKAIVWEVWDRATGIRLILCDGYDDLLEEPAEPFPKLERFYPLFAQTVTEADVDVNLPDEDLTCYPQSIVRRVMPMQNEWNRQRRSLQSHRVSNTPVYGLIGGTDDDAKNLRAEKRGPVVIRFQGLDQNADVNKMLQRVQFAPIDPALYDISAVKEDILMVIGAQEANLGPTANATATEASIAEGSRLSATSSLVDEIDDLLSELARAAGEVLLTEMPADLVREIVGPGAVFPTFDRESVKQQLYLEVQASSTGRPNRQIEAQNFQALAPILMQIPGIRPGFMAQQAVKRLDDRLDLEEAFEEGGPSVQAANALQSRPPEMPELGVDGFGNGVKAPAATAGMPPQMENRMMQSAGLREGGA